MVLKYILYFRSKAIFSFFITLFTNSNIVIPDKKVTIIINIFVIIIKEFVNNLNISGIYAVSGL